MLMVWNTELKCVLLKILTYKRKFKLWKLKICKLYGVFNTTSQNINVLFVEVGSTETGYRL